jgi:general secretion pathway protein A
MKGNRDAGLGVGIRGPRANPRDLPVSSRRAALETFRQTVVSEGAGLLLLTGEPGAGKTWLWRRLVRDLPTTWRWVCVELSEALDALEFLRMIGDGLGIAVPDQLGAARLAVASALADESTDGRSWLLIVENAHHASDAARDEIGALVHAMEASGGFAALVLAGPTELARQLSARRSAGLAARLGAHVHLLPLDLDEARELVECQGGAAPSDQAILEEIHRDAGGNPRRLLQLLRRRARPSLPPAARNEPATPATSPEPVSGQKPATEDGALEHDRRAIPPVPREALATPLVPSRPPLRVEDGLIEVGWEGSLEGESMAGTSDATSIAGLEVDTPEPVASPLPPIVDEGDLPSEEMIEDHYAALQAWTEWARNRGRATDTTAAGAPGESIPHVPAAAGPDHPRRAPAEPLPSAVLRAESQHEHAPYSQLFSRLRQAR